MSEWLIISLNFPYYVMTNKIFSVGKLYQAGQKNNKVVVSFYCINKLSIKMFIKRKTRAEGLYLPNASEF